MAKIIEARAVLSGEDKLSPLLDRVGKKMKEVGAAAGQSAAVEKMAAALAKVASQVQAMEKFNAAKLGFANARQNFREAEQAVERAAAAMKAAQGPTRQLEAEYRRAQAAVSAASRAFDHQKNAVLGAKHSLESMGGSISNMVGQQQRLAAAVEKASASMRRQANWAARRRELGILGSYAGIAAGHAASHGARATLRTYREFDRERRFGKAVMGITDQEQAPLVGQAIHLGATTKFNDIQVLEAQRELAARGLPLPAVQGLIGPAANLAMALDLKLPDAARQMEGALFGFKRDLSSTGAATASATRTADLQTKAAKISGMKPEDLTQLYKYGATPARMAGMSEETLLAFGGILKKANMGGDEAGVAFRALMAASQSPTRGAKEALLANGLNFKNYQKNPSSLALAPFVENVAAQYGVKLSGKAQAGLGGIFSNKDLILDPAKFTPAVMSFLKGSLGGNDAKSLRSIAGAANRYRSASMQGIDTNAFVGDLMTKIAGNLQFANALFGSKQGGRIATALGDPATFKKMVEELEKHSQGYSGSIAAERMAGFDGAVSRFEGAVKNMETAIGRAFDSGGSGGPLTEVTNWAGRLAQGFAELGPNVIQVSTAFAGAAAAIVGLKGIINISSLLFGDGGLKGSALALNESAAALTAAAARLGGGAVATTAATTGGAVAATTIGGALTWSAIMRGAPIAAALGGMAVMKHDSETEGQPLRTQLRALFGIPDDHEPAPWRQGGAFDTQPRGPVEVNGKVTGDAKITIDLTGLGLQRSWNVNVPLNGSVNGPGSLGQSSPDAAAPSGVGHN